MVHEVDETSLEATGKKNSVGVLHQVEKRISCAPDDTVFAVLLLTDPSFVMTIDQIVAEDDADVVKLESLSRVNASHLSNAPRVVGPEALWRYAAMQSPLS